MKEYAIIMITAMQTCLKNMKEIKYLPGEKSLKVPFIIYADLECLLKKVRSCQNNPENSYTVKKIKRKPSGHAWCSICSLMRQKTNAIFIEEKMKSKCK